MGTIESTATRLAESGAGYRARVTRPGYLEGYLVTVTPSGQVWTSGGLSHLTPADCTPCPDPDRP